MTFESIATTKGKTVNKHLLIAIAAAFALAACGKEAPPAPKKDEPKKEEVKKDEPKKDEAKKDQPKADEGAKKDPIKPGK